MTVSELQSLLDEWVTVGLGDCNVYTLPKVELVLSNYDSVFLNVGWGNKLSKE